MKRRRLLVLIAATVCLFLVAPVAGFFLLSSPRFVNGLSGLLENQTGYRLRVRDISIDRHLNASIEGLQLRSVRDGNLFLTLQTAQVNGKVVSPFRIEIQRMVLKRPKFVFQVKKSDEETGLFSTLEKLPPLRLLVIEDGSLEIRTDQAKYTIPAIQLTVRDFAPRAGGDLKMEGRLDVTSPDYGLTGRFEGALRMVRFAPRPSGSGSLLLTLDNGFFTPASWEKATVNSNLRIDGDVLSLLDTKIDIGALSSGKGPQEMAIGDLHLKTNGSYDQKTSGFTVDSLEGAGTGIGTLRGRGKGFLIPLSWDASLGAQNVDVSKAFAIMGPLLPEDYRKWRFRGIGALDARTVGQTDGSLTWRADVSLDLKEGGFASADNLKAGERINGKVHLKLESPRKGEKGRFDVAMRAGNAEFLWGKYYRDFKDEFLELSSHGTFDGSPFSLSFAGSTDLFRTGRYSFSADITPAVYHVSVAGSGLSHERLFALFAQDYVTQSYGITDLSLKGTTDISFTTDTSGGKTSISGSLDIREGAMNLPSQAVSVEGLRLSLPFLLEYPDAGNDDAAGTDAGLLSVRSLAAGDVSINGLRVPLLLSKNSLLVQSALEIPIFGGQARVEHFRMNGILSSDVRIETALFARNIDLGAITGKAVSVPVNGSVSVDLPSIVSESGIWKAQGKVESNVFGGRIEVTGLFGEQLFSSARSFGGDVRFEDIDLEAITEKIEVGRVSGTIRGFAEKLAFEYGQPSRFIFTVETDPSTDGSGTISVDAIKNLSIISTGGPAISSILNSGVNRFFKEYPYSRIGIACTLENDVFTLRGTIHEGGREYLVRRGFLRGIDVINQNPDNSISFKDMQERIGRIFRPRQEPGSVS